ncbi:MAG: ankyrin repeat domain-containing protein [Fimbriimonadaceae bacterium]
MNESSKILTAIGGETGCKRLSKDFYTLVANDTTLKRLFPGKSLRCATEEFSAFLIQFLGGDESHTQYRWWLSLRQSHSRFTISQGERDAWLANMKIAIENSTVDPAFKDIIVQFFTEASLYLLGQNHSPIRHPEFDFCWNRQLKLDSLVAFLASGQTDEVIKLAPDFAERPSVFIGLLDKMLEENASVYEPFVVRWLNDKPSLLSHRFNGRTLLHFAVKNGCLSTTQTALSFGIDPDVLDNGDRTPLYALANGCNKPTGPSIVNALINAGADVNSRNGVMKTTPLHMAARQGHLEIAKALLKCGADPSIPDKNGMTPLMRAKNCMRRTVVELLSNMANP